MSSLFDKDSDLNADSLGGRVCYELDALGNVTLQAIVASLQELLLVVVDVANNVNGLLGTTGLRRS